MSFKIKEKYNSEYRFGFGYNKYYVCIVKYDAMSRELTEFSDLIDEQFDKEETETDTFWNEIINLFI